MLYRRAGRPWPRSVDGPWDWPPIARARRLERRAACALTIAPAWGVSAAPSVPGRLGRGGPWEAEARAIERAYGRDRTLHVSLEEFARTLPVVRETRERLREGGVPARALGRRLAESRRRREDVEFRRAFERFRAFDRPNVLHLFATFRPDRRFGREFPLAVQCGPLWPRRFPRARSRGRPLAPDRREWIWYASPASAEAIAPEVIAGLASDDPPIQLYVRTPRPWAIPVPTDRVRVVTEPVDREEWRRRFGRAELRIVTGSRTLLEALELGGPWLYFNGVLGRGRGRRRHRPEKIAALLDLGRRRGVDPALLRDVAAFARGRRVEEVVARAAARTGPWARFPRSFGRPEFEPPYDDAGALVVAAAQALAREGGRAEDIVRAIRDASKG